MPGLIVALVGAVASFALWQQQSASVEAMAGVRFTQEARSFSEALELRLGSHFELLNGLRSLFVIQPGLSRRDFERVASDLDLTRYRGSVRNVAFTRYVPAADKATFEAQARANASADGTLYPDFSIHPPGDRPEYFVVDYLWPRMGNAGVLGLDIVSQPANLEALLRSRETGRIVASSPFDLVQEQVFRTGVIIRVPVFSSEPGGVPRFVGSMGATVRVHDMIASLREEGYLQGVALAMDDVGLAGTTAAASTPVPLLLLDAAPVPAAERHAREIDVGGRRWRLSFQPVSDFLSPSERRMPWLLALGGLLVTALLTALVTLLVLRRAQALNDVRLAGGALEDSEERFRTVFRQAAVGVAQTNTKTGQLVRVNEKFGNVLGYSVEELQQMRFQDFTHPDDLQTDLALTERMAAGEVPEFHLEKRYLHKDGHIVWAHLTVSPMRTPGGPPEFHIAVMQDITARKHMEEALRNSEQRLRGILLRIPVGVCLVQKDGTIAFRNERYLQICGYDEDLAPDVDSWWRLCFPDPDRRDVARAEWRAAREAAVAGDGSIAPHEYVLTGRDGQMRTVETSGVLLGDDHLVTMVDLSQRKAAEEEIHSLAYYDPLTRLPNRRLLLDRLQQALAVSARRQRCGAVLMLDLDNFKTLNETRGLDRGDALLREVSLRLRGCVQGQDTVARHGGDEFVVVLEDLDDTPQEAGARAEEAGQRILTALRQPFVLDGEAHHSTLSMGITIFQGQRESAEELLKRGELAMYQAKAAGRNTLQFYDPQMQALVESRAALESDMRAGLAQGQFELFYQPQVVHGRITGAEALLRWRHPAKGFISPAEFIPLAEDCGLILPLGEWVLRTACERLAQWAQQPEMATLGLAVNVSPRQFHQSGFVAQVLAALASTGADGRRLKLELTEGLLLQDVEDTIAKMGQLRAYGVGFSLDDFGTGYSSLAYLKRLPLDELKIDQSFVRDVLTDPNDAAIARTIVALGTSLGLRVIAEGVETEPQRAFLERNHCHAWQGYLLSRPLPGTDFEALVHAHRVIA
ncbi:MAG: EAL domain-containing protein [Comamonadaceae bacterium]|nr:MAG: EAL domain-containing protein [Comamonadaceae bacterium]